MNLCTQNHANKTWRVRKMTLGGWTDTRATLSIAGHVTGYAEERFKLKGLITPADRDRTFHMKGGKGGGEMYNFLKWKLGGPTAVAAQWLSAGYQHFDKAYSDEAAGILLGVIRFDKVEPELVMPPWMQARLKRIAAQSGQDVAGVLVAYGVPGPVAQMIGNEVSKRAPGAVDKIAKTFIPKSYDVDNRLIEAAISARR